MSKGEQVSISVIKINLMRMFTVLSQLRKAEFQEEHTGCVVELLQCTQRITYELKALGRYSKSLPIERDFFGE